MESITLLPAQVPHAIRLKAILGMYPLALDLSMLGAGKTFTASHLALDKELGFTRVVVIAPVSVLPKWDDIRTTYGVPITESMSYSSLRSMKCKQPKHGLLVRRDYTVDMNLQGTVVAVDKVDFACTALFRRYVLEGVLLVVDEIQSIKNVSTQFLACKTMIRAIVEAHAEGGVDVGDRPLSRVLLLSGSPIDRQEQVLALFRTMHVMKCDELAAYNIGRRVLEWRGLADIEAHCRTLDSDMVDLLRLKHSYKRGAGRLVEVRADALEVYCYDLFQRVFKPARASVMPVPEFSTRVHKMNAFFEVVDPQERAVLKLGVEALSRACSFNTATGEVAHQSGGGNTALASLQRITRALLQIETGKIGTFVQVAKSILDRYPHAKVVICVNYIATLRDLSVALSGYSPLMLDGSTSVLKRAAILRQFQTPTIAHRLLLGNVSVMSTGIDLDDKDGRFPRTALVNPSYNTIALYQLGHRFLRADTKSDAGVLFVFGKHATEMRVLQALARKANIMKETTQEQSSAGVVFPGDHLRVDGDLHLLHQERGLVGISQVASEDQEGTTVLCPETCETSVADGDEVQPAVPEERHLRAVFAAEQETLEVVGGSDIHVQNTCEVDGPPPALVESVHAPGPADFVNLAHHVTGPQAQNGSAMLVAENVPKHGASGEAHHC